MVCVYVSLSMGKFSPKFTPFTCVWFVSLISDKVQVVGLSHNWMKKIRSPWVESRNNIFAQFSIFFSLSFSLDCLLTWRFKCLELAFTTAADIPSEDNSHLDGWMKEMGKRKRKKGMNRLSSAAAVL
jgi:hypothetical protein